MIAPDDNSPDLAVSLRHGFALMLETACNDFDGLQRLIWQDAGDVPYQRDGLGVSDRMKGRC